ncbi:MAG: UvrD-helicase domain-containing protein, partial [Candidatus Sedimenticola sp. 6PFRAG1]
LGAVPGPWFDNFTKFTTATLQASLKKGGIAPEHSFFDLCGEFLEQREQQQQGYESLLISLQVQLVDYVNRDLAERKESRGVQSYNDLLLHLDQALNGKRGEALTKALKQRYGAALIDEFQDTDPVQYRIFSRIYAGDEAPAYLVGDPKQAIYSFRGADIFAYIEARDDAREQFTLDTNWRSDARLIKGVNTLFSVGHGGFLFHEIPFQQALAAPEEQLNRPRLLDSGAVNEPLRVGFIAGQPSKELATRWAVSWTAAEINRLLEGGRSGEITLGADALTSKDIAVLVRSHAQGSKIRDALRDYGIYSVLRTQDNVFHSREAQELERVMSAVVEPGREVS